MWRNACKRGKERKDKYILVHIHTKMFLNNQNPTSPRKLINTISVSKFYFVYLSSHKKKARLLMREENSLISSRANPIY